MSINVIGCDPRQGCCLIDTFTHGFSLTLGLPDTLLIIADRTIRTKHSYTRGIQNGTTRPLIAVTVQLIDLLLRLTV
ncbi:hypothetical protein D3C75_1268330 [compost metagenome]